jgi:phosphotransacetylase
MPGARRPTDILRPTSTVRRLVNMTALTAVAAQRRKKPRLSIFCVQFARYP